MFYGKTEQDVYPVRFDNRKIISLHEYGCKCYGFRLQE